VAAGYNWLPIAIDGKGVLGYNRGILGFTPPASRKAPTGRPHGRLLTIIKYSSAVRRPYQEGVSKREIARRIGMSRASVRGLLGDGNP
jgi:DNA invertase Pin-like site-specific DNA recombinase